MKKHKINFKKNSILMLSLIVVIALGIFFIDILKDKTDKGVKLGGRFLLIDQNEMDFDSKTSNKNKLIYFGYTYCPDVCPFESYSLFDTLPSHFPLPRGLSLENPQDEACGKKWQRGK